MYHGHVFKLLSANKDELYRSTSPEPTSVKFESRVKLECSNLKISSSLFSFFFFFRYVKRMYQRYKNSKVFELFSKRSESRFDWQLLSREVNIPWDPFK